MTFFFFFFVDKGLHNFLLHWALQIMELALPTRHIWAPRQINWVWIPALALADLGQIVLSKAQFTHM